MPITEKHDRTKVKNPDRFYCPFPGCNRSFAELWRLKVHYRAPPDVRGSGKERGHGTELQLCPKCGKDLKPGKHHVGCSAGRSAPRQAAKRVKMECELQGGVAIGQPVMGYPVNHTDSHFFNFAGNGGDDVFGLGPSSRPAGDAQQPALAVPVPPAAQHPQQGLASGVAAGRLQPPYANGHASSSTDLLRLPGAAAKSDQRSDAAKPGDAHDDLLFGFGQPFPGMVSAGAEPIFGVGDPRIVLQSLGWGAYQSAPAPLAADGTGGAHHQLWPGSAAAGPSSAVPEPSGGGRNSSKSSSSSQRPPSPQLLHCPSPPPLPSDLDLGGGTRGPAPLLFDFDSFNANRPQKELEPSNRPFVTVTTAMNPADMAFPSDDYIMQILFGDINEPVPRRMTTHLHHFEDSPGLGEMEPKGAAGTPDVFDDIFNFAGSRPEGLQPSGQATVPVLPSVMPPSVVRSLQPPPLPPVVTGRPMEPLHAAMAQVSAPMKLQHENPTLAVPH